MWKTKYYLGRENKVDENKVLSYCEALRYMQNTMENNEKDVLNYVKLTNPITKLISKKMYQHIGSKWLIQGTKNRKDIQLIHVSKRGHRRIFQATSSGVAWCAVNLCTRQICHMVFEITRGFVEAAVVHLAGMFHNDNIHLALALVFDWLRIILLMNDYIYINICIWESD